MLVWKRHPSCTVEHLGVRIYRTYIGGDLSKPSRYVYTTHPHCGQGACACPRRNPRTCLRAFDVTHLPNWRSDEHLSALSKWDHVEFTIAHIRAVLREAIELGHITRDGMIVRFYSDAVGMAPT